MPGSAAVLFAPAAAPLDTQAFFALLGSDAFPPALHRTDRSELAVQGTRHAVQDFGEFAVAVAGEILSPARPDWRQIVAGLAAGSRRFPEMAGRFSVTIVHPGSRRAWLVSDYLGQYPAWYRTTGEWVGFASSPAAFCRLSPLPGFDPGWLVDKLAFNFSPAHRSFLEGVRRMPPASVLTLDLDSLAIGMDRWAEAPEARVPEAPAEVEIERAIAVFRERAPLYVHEGEAPVAGLTSGFDSRTILALYMDTPGFETFTYGVPDCLDIREAEALASSLRLPHRVVAFDAGFEAELPALAVDCVWLSGGQQDCIRSTLLHAYRQLGDAGGAPRVLLSGVSGDQLFRGHGNVPSIVSRLLDDAFRGRPLERRLDVLAQGFRDAAAADGQLRDTLAGLAERFGPLSEPVAAMSYLTWIVPAAYFAGEAVLADTRLSFRSPFCDPDIVRLAWSTSLSSLAFSKFAGQREDNLAKNRLPASLIAANPRLAATRIQDRPLSAFARGHRGYYLAASAWSRATRRFRRGSWARRAPPLEDWTRWFDGPLAPLVSRLLDDDARIGAWLTPEAIRETLAHGGPRRIAQLASAEMTLRMAERGWQRDAV